MKDMQHTQTPKGFVSTLLPPIQSTTSPNYNAKPTVSFSDMFSSNTVTQKSRTSYKNNAPAPVYVALSNDEPDTYGNPEAPVLQENIPVGPQINEPPMFVQGNEEDSYGTSLGQPISTVKNDFLVHFFSTREAVALHTNDPIMLERLI